MTCLLFLLKVCFIFHFAFSIEINEEMKSSSFRYSSSVMSMTKLLQMENELLGDLKDYAKELQQKLDMIELYQQMLKRPDLHDLEAEEEYMANPLNAFPLMRRLQQDWPKWLTYLKGGAMQEKLEHMQLKLKNAPSKKDLLVATKGLLRIESYYDLEASHMAKGLLLNNQYDSHLDSADCVALGSQLFNETKYSESTHWFRNAIRLYKQPYGKVFDQVLGLKRKQLYRAYASAIARETHKSEELSTNTTPAEWKDVADKMINELVLKASNADIKKLINEYLAIDEKIFIKERAKLKVKPTTMQRGCRGLWPKRESEQLTCRYVGPKSPFLPIAQLKMEMLNEEPLIALYHEVLPDSEIESLKNAVKYQTAKDLKKETAKWYSLEMSEERLKLRYIFFFALKLDLIDQNMHFYNYGLGGYLPRNSNSTCRGPNLKTKPKSSSGTIGIKFQERCHSKHVGNLLFYASDVALGGATVFPNLKLVVQPKRGSALIWFNRNKNEEPEKLAEHAVCPVAMGSRWVISNCLNDARKLLEQHCLA